MVTATRRRTLEVAQPITNPNVEVRIETRSKRKSDTAVAPNTQTRGGKRRKRASLESNQEIESETPSETPEVTQEVDAEAEPQPEPEAQPEPEPEEKPATNGPTKHFRFDSEEPEIPLDTPAEENTETPQEKEDSDDDSSDDEAPEAIDNSAQLSKIRSEAKKLEQAKQLEEQAKKEKRRQLDELRKSQAKISNKKDKLADDLLSESTETLQGSTTQDIQRSALPALLPDDILNAAPATRPLTPPLEEPEAGPKKSNKLRFLEKNEKRPKDVRMGDVTIRVLDGEPPQKKAKTSLAPKASKTGRNAKENWLNKSRSTGNVNGLRRTKGGPSGFVRR
ncbi:hypothetical protein P170DRAFT_476526 [Aspergillus steynii IBT 23096]|uniref:Immediate-early protein n=1 Tax=Aspergillus steynii IBT 23096 TaxID=1392250 RepID=A0A2I2G4Q5_9EURO|nr:uncharacterized protein P170DRAFT_476526 [Aspergillus steynii IBT 23096]PLB47866.1 hypothetical protein P170DRAFT_476526 [Aspergillus steynii IBT 23096]